MIIDGNKLYTEKMDTNTNISMPADDVGILNTPYNTVILFDLDGTLLDTSEGIFNSVRYTERKLMLKPIEYDRLIDFVGPPPAVMYRDIYGLDEQMALKATALHREYGLNNGIHEFKKYPQIDKVLESLKNLGYKLGVSTLKKQNIAEAVLIESGLCSLFDVVIGMNNEESYTKADTIEIAMQVISAYKAIMIGDSIYDYEGAFRVGIPFIGVLYGFGLSSKEKYPFKTINKPEEIIQIFEG